jgi:hypothetical protein
MKKILLIAVAAFISVSVYAQGTLNFSTVGAPGVLQAVEKGGLAVPAGATFQAGLFFAPAGVTDDSMFMQVGAPGSFISGGRVFAGTRETPSSGTFNFQVRVWEVADPNHKGSSSIFAITTGNPNGTPATPPANIVPGFDGIQMSVVPEPSVIALGALGAGALLMLRRRK